MNTKRKVGRPKLADAGLKKKSVLYVIVSFILIIFLVGILFTREINYTSLQGKSSKFIYYSQKDPRWGRKNYCGSNSTYSGGACGPTAMAMVVANLTNNRSFTPEDAAKEAKAAKQCGKGIFGTNSGFFKYSAKKHNIKYGTVSHKSSKKTKLKKLKNVLRNGGYIIVDVNKKSPFTSAFHYVLIYKIDSNDNVYVANPNEKTKMSTKYRLEDFMSKGWLYTGVPWMTFESKDNNTAKKKGVKSKSNVTTKKKAAAKTIEAVDSEDEIKSSKISNKLEKVLKLKEGTCPIAPMIEGVKADSTTYATNKVKITINTSNLSSDELNNLYILEKKYNKDQKLTYKIKGKTKKEKIGMFEARSLDLVTKVLTKSNNYYSKVINTGDYYYIAIYSGGKKCYYNYFITDGMVVKNYTRRYRLTRYNILTKKGVIKGVASNTTITSSNERIMKINNNYDGVSYKSTGQNVITGHESANNKIAKIRISNQNNSGVFTLQIPSRYYVSGYLLNPLTKNNKQLPKVSGISKVSHTKNSEGKKVYGVELKTSANKKVYAMDSGTVVEVRNKKSKKDTYGKFIQINSSIRGEKYIHTYANLSSIKVKKGDRVYKGQPIGKTAKSYLYVSFTQKSGASSSKKSYNSLLLNNFVGRKIFYARVNDSTYKAFQSYIGDEKLCLYQYDESICDENIVTTTINTTKPQTDKVTTKKSTTKKQTSKDSYTKILLIGNSYTYYNGYGQMISKLAKKTGKKVIVVRATKNEAGAIALAKINLKYVAWSSEKGKIGSGANKTLSQILNIDFGNLKRASKWDYVVLQNNDGDGSVVKGDKAIYNKIKNNIPKSKNFIINATTYGKGTGSKRYQLHLSAAKSIHASVVRSGQLFEKYGKAYNRDWHKDLTVCDGNYHQSGRGAYLNALATYAKIYGVSEFATSKNSSKFIELYNKNGGTTKEFANDFFRKNKNNSKPSTVSYSVDKETAKKLQALVRKNYKSSVLAY